jgi:hypothetical protein
MLREASQRLTLNEARQLLMTLSSVGPQADPDRDYCATGLQPADAGQVHQDSATQGRALRDADTLDSKNAWPLTPKVSDCYSEADDAIPVSSTVAAAPQREQHQEQRSPGNDTAQDATMAGSCRAESSTGRATADNCLVIRGVPVLQSRLPTNFGCLYCHESHHTKVITTCRDIIAGYGSQ